MLMFGIDPGVTTGLGGWDVNARLLTLVTAMKIHLAMQLLQQATDKARAAGGTLPLVVLEDSRYWTVSSWAQDKAGSAKLQGVGSVKRDCGIWHDFLEDLGVPFITKMPNSALTKWPADRFRAHTGWEGKTNNHGRDAALLVFGTNLPMANGMVSQFRQVRAEASRHIIAGNRRA